MRVLAVGPVCCSEVSRWALTGPRSTARWPARVHLQHRRLCQRQAPRLLPRISAAPPETADGKSSLAESEGASADLGVIWGRLLKVRHRRGRRQATTAAVPCCVAMHTVLICTAPLPRGYALRKSTSTALDCTVTRRGPRRLVCVGHFTCPAVMERRIHAVRTDSALHPDVPK